MITYICFIVGVALLFDFYNGMNDAANSIATIVSTRVLSPRQAVLWAAFFNFVAAFGFSTHVAKTIGKGLVTPEIIDPHLVLATLVSAIVWTVYCTHKGLPISVSHTLIGALAGTAIAKGGFTALYWSAVGKIALFIVLSPAIGLILGWVLMVAVLWMFHTLTPRMLGHVFRPLQLVSAALYSLSHGLNDAQKTMGIIVALLISVPSLQSYATRGGETGSGELAWWIILSCHAAIAVGTYTGGWRVIRTLGHNVTKLQPMSGFCAETAGGLTILLASNFGIPVSTTHTITGAIFGVGMTRPMFGIRWRIGVDIARAWVLTLPAAGVMAAAIFLILRQALRWLGLE